MTSPDWMEISGILNLMRPHSRISINSNIDRNELPMSIKAWKYSLESGGVPRTELKFGLIP